MGLGRTLLARSAKGRKVNGQIKTRRGWYSESWGQLCLSISVFTFTAGNASSTNGPAPLDHLHCRIAEHRLGTCLNAPTRADRVGWQQPACVTSPTLSSSESTFRRNLLLPLQDRIAHTFTQNCYAHPPHCRVLIAEAFGACSGSIRFTSPLAHKHSDCGAKGCPSVPSDKLTANYGTASPFHALSN
jgi:hypothetical protein